MQQVHSREEIRRELETAIVLKDQTNGPWDTRLMKIHIKLRSWCLLKYQSGPFGFESSFTEWLECPNADQRLEEMVNEIYGAQFDHEFI